MSCVLKVLKNIKIKKTANYVYLGVKMLLQKDLLLSSLIMRAF